MKSLSLVIGFSPSRSLVKFLKYSIVGLLGTVSDFSLTVLLVELTFLAAPVASSCGFVVAVIQNFLLNRFWTFPEANQHRFQSQMFRFVVVSVVGLAIHTVVFVVTNMLFRSSMPDGYRLAKLIAIFVVLWWNFTMNRHWTFSQANRLSS